MTDSIAVRQAILSAPDDALVTGKEVAQGFPVKETSLRLWAHRKAEGKPLPVRKFNGKNLYLVRDIRSWFGSAA